MRAVGDRVFITGRREAPLQAVATRPAPRRWWAMPPTARWRQRLLPAILDQTGGIDVLICSAGGWATAPPPRPATANGARRWTAILTSAFASVRACLPSLIARRGNAVCRPIASLAAGPQACGYVTAKHALIGLMRPSPAIIAPRGYALTLSVPVGHDADGG